MKKKLTFIKQEVSNQIHNQRTSVLHQKFTIQGALAQPFDLNKISKLSIYTQNCCNYQERDRTTAFKVFSRCLLCQTVQAFSCQTRARLSYVLCRKIHPEGNFGLTICTHGRSQHAFHLWGERRSQLSPLFSITTFIGIRTRPDTHECSRRAHDFFESIRRLEAMQIFFCDQYGRCRC
jgi:hypothetical protein